MRVASSGPLFVTTAHCSSSYVAIMVVKSNKKDLVSQKKTCSTNRKDIPKTFKPSFVAHYGPSFVTTAHCLWCNDHDSKASLCQVSLALQVVIRVTVNRILDEINESQKGACGRHDWDRKAGSDTSIMPVITWREQWLERWPKELNLKVTLAPWHCHWQWETGVRLSESSAQAGVIDNHRRWTPSQPRERIPSHSLYTGTGRTTTRRGSKHWNKLET